jgi:hypothetical protein
MKTIHGTLVIESINDFLHDPKESNNFYTWQSEKSNDFINYPERAARCHDAAADGCDGSYAHEVIDDFREFGRELLTDAWRSISSDLCEIEDDDEAFRMECQFESEYDACYAAFEADCDRLEKWHIENGTYEQQCG